MSMSTEQALEYFNKGQEPKKEEPAKVEEAKQEPEVKDEAPSAEPEKKEPEPEETNVSSPGGANKDDGVQPEDKAKGSDEPKDEPKDVENKEKSKRDYAFERVKNKNRALKEKYDSLNESSKQKDRRIKELEEQLGKYENLQSEDFKKQDGSTDIDAYTNWKLHERDMQQEVRNLKQSKEEDRRRYALEYDRYCTERCFDGKELEDYDRLVATKGRDFAEAISEVDRNGVVFGYLDTIKDYPIVLRELMSNPDKWLGRMFRSTDPDILKRNTADIADQIVSEYWNSKKSASKPAVEPASKPKPAMPVIGKQLSSSAAGTASEPQSLVSSMKSINDYLAKHKR